MLRVMPDPAPADDPPAPPSGAKSPAPIPAATPTAAGGSTKPPKPKLIELRKELAERIAEGLAGWFQLQGAQRLDDLPGEDSTRFVLCQIVRAAHGFRVKTSQRPKNWPESTKQRIDIAIMGTTANAKGWNGAIEAKWPGKNFDRDKTRLAIIQDCVRLASVDAANLNAFFLVLGGSKAALSKLFDDVHAQKAHLEDRRKVFDAFLSRTSGKKKLTIEQLKSTWGTATKKDGNDVLRAFERVPEDAAPTGPIEAELIASHEAVAVKQPLGAVYVWQVSKQRGARAEAK
jgi:hypothetical protein